MSRAIYLDNNATTPLRPEAQAAMTRAMEVTGNASSVHGFGRKARKFVEDAREQVAALTGVSAQNLIFTSGGSEANNAFLRGVHADAVFVSAVEHASVLDARPDAVQLSVDGAGLVDLEALATSLSQSEGRSLVSVMGANNETGVLQPIQQIADMVHEADGLLHVDAIQMAGKMPLLEVVSVADAISLSAHKLGGPAGVGALIVRDGVPFEPLVRGGGQERRRRAGTENVIGIAGFGAAAEAAREGLSSYAAVSGLRDRIEDALASEAVIYGAGTERLPNTTCIGMAGVAAETQVMALDLAGIAVSAGSACSSGKVEPSHVLRAMGVDDDAAAQAVRVSLGHDTSLDDIDAFITAWRQVRERTAAEAAA